ncbi:MAG TPA: vitamin K epoxide reductase family protein [Acidimicrobiales bacterium]|nr:vitamin K epoxide reductase family protein [Acidimicrobiales bacterium]
MNTDGRGRGQDNGRHDDTPPGWTSNPSIWAQRLPIIGLALIGTGIAGYLGAFQLGLIDSVWEPFFGDGSQTVLTSKTSHLLPVPDAVLGALSYVADAVTGAIGGTKRWKTMPWIVIIFGIAVGPLGAISILLVILQPVLYDSFCTLCLASAVVSVAMIGPAVDEVLASLQFLKRRRTQGRSLWRAFWGVDGDDDVTASPTELAGAGGAR